MIGFVGALVTVAIVAAIVITDAVPRQRPQVKSNLAPFDAPLHESGNGLDHQEQSAVSLWSDPRLDPSAGFDAVESELRSEASRSSTAIDLVPSGAKSPGGAPFLHPDPERLIQTEVAIRQDASVRWLAVARLVLAVVGFAAAVAMGVIGVARAIGFVIKKLAGGG